MNVVSRCRKGKSTGPDRRLYCPRPGRRPRAAQEKAPLRRSWCFDISLTIGAYSRQWVRKSAARSSRPPWLRRSTRPPHTPSVTRRSLISCACRGSRSPGEMGEQGALGLTAFYRAVALICGTIAALPLKVFRDVGNGDREQVDHFLSATPAGPYDLSQFAWVEMVMLHQLLHAETFLRTITNVGGEIVGLWPIHPLAVTQGRVGRGRQAVHDGDGERGAGEALHGRGHAHRRHDARRAARHVPADDLPQRAHHGAAGETAARSRSRRGRRSPGW